MPVTVKTAFSLFHCYFVCLFTSAELRCLSQSFCFCLVPLLLSLSGEKLSKCCHSNTALKYLPLPFPLLYLSKLWLQNVAEKRFELRVQTLAASGTTLVPLLLKDRNLPELSLLGFTFHFSNKYGGTTVGFFFFFVTVPAVSERKQLW